MDKDKGSMTFDLRDIWSLEKTQTNKYCKNFKNFFLLFPQILLAGATSKNS